MDERRFLDSAAGQLVRGRLADDTLYWAFVPAPLPPELPFGADWVQALSAADRALGELQGLGQALPASHVLLLGKPLLRREAVLSSRIEGTQADLADLYAYEAGQPSLPGFAPPPPESDVREVLNYVEALDYGLERVHSLPVSLRLICELHERLLQGVRGERTRPGRFRTEQNWIGAVGCALPDARFVPPPPAEMCDALHALENYLHAEDHYPALARLAFVHYQFEAIHPFLDGNGRIGRLLISLLLVDWGLLTLPLLYLSAYFERHRQEYYELLLAVSERGEWKEWVLFFLRGVAQQAQDTVSRFRRLHELRTTWHGQLAQARASALLLRLIDELFARPLLTIPQVADILGVTYRSAQLNVHKLLGAGILEEVGASSYGRTFLARNILDVINED